MTLRQDSGASLALATYITRHNGLRSCTVSKQSHEHRPVSMVTLRLGVRACTPPQLLIMKAPGPSGSVAPESWSHLQWTAALSARYDNFNRDVGLGPAHPWSAPGLKPGVRPGANPGSSAAERLRTPAFERRPAECARRGAYLPGGPKRSGLDPTGA
jgi:hypothetical protein